MKTLALAAPTMSMLLMLSACARTDLPTSAGSSKAEQPYLAIRSCTTSLSSIRCTVVGYPSSTRPVLADVTDTATWTVADSLSDDGLAVSSAATITAPGVVTPTGVAKISIHARTSFGHAMAWHTYAVAPGAQPIPLAPYVTGYVRETDGTTPITGAVIEVTEGGVSTGASASLRTDGYYSLRDIIMNSPITVKVSKPGYVTETGVYQGFVDGDTGYPLNTAQFNFRLKRAQ